MIQLFTWIVVIAAIAVISALYHAFGRYSSQRLEKSLFWFFLILAGIDVVLMAGGIIYGIPK